MQLVSFSNVMEYLDDLVARGQLNHSERLAFQDRMTMMENTPSQVLKELQQRFEEPGGHGAILEPGNGGGGGGGGSGSEGESLLKVGGFGMLPVVLGAPLVAGIALRLAGVLVRTGSIIKIPWTLFRTLSPATQNALQVIAVGAGLMTEDLLTEAINEMMGQGDPEAAVYEITGSEAELSQLMAGGTGGMGLTLVPGLGNLPPGVWIVKQWRAPRIGGVQFYKFSNGLIAVQKLDGTWKVYRPKKPIVLYAGVGNNRRSIMRAAHIVRAEVKAWKSMEKFFGMQRRRALPAAKRGRSVVIEHGSGSVVTD